MDFKISKTIYMQIADSICEKILSGVLEVDKKIPSVREMAAEKGVNPNTIMRSFTDLQSRGVIRNQRGIGYFVEKQAQMIILKERKTNFFQEDFPEFIQKLALLQLSQDEIKKIVESINTIGYETK